MTVLSDDTKACYISSMNSADSEQLKIIEEFKNLKDWESKYTRIIDLGKSLKQIDEKFKIDDLKVKGCQSQVWLFCELDAQQKLSIIADSEPEAKIVRGLISLLLRVFSQRSLEEVMTTKPFFITEIGLDTHLSPSRTNGLLAMIKQIKFYAMALQARENAKRSKLN